MKFYLVADSLGPKLRQIDTLVICGVSTSGCVRASALGAMCYGFRPMVSLAKQILRSVS